MISEYILHTGVNRPRCDFLVHRIDQKQANLRDLLCCVFEKYLKQSPDAMCMFYRNWFLCSYQNLQVLVAGIFAICQGCSLPLTNKLHSLQLVVDHLFAFASESVAKSFGNRNKLFNCN